MVNQFRLILLLFSVLSFSHQEHPAKRIIGGTAAKEGQFPFAAAIYSQSTAGRFFCGGALISDQWIITSGSCVDGFATFSITLGSNVVNSTSEGVLNLVANTYLLHPDYNPTTLENDIGLIQLSAPVTFTDNIQPIALTVKDVMIYAFVTTVGWGQVSDGDTSLASSLQSVVVSVLTNSECRAYFGTQIRDNMVCASGIINQGNCLGDTGGPLIYYIFGVEPTLVGISSFLSGNGCEAPDPSGFTRVFPYLGWIRNNTGLV